MHTTTGTDLPNLRAVTLSKIIWCDPDELDYYSPGAREHSEAHIDRFAQAIRA